MTVSYLEWTQNLQRERWSEDRVNGRLKELMEAATDLVLDRPTRTACRSALPRTRSPWSAWRTRAAREVGTESAWRADVVVDVERLRVERLARLQAAMRAHDLEVLLLSNEPNIRYATGATAMPVYAMSTFVRCAVVPQEGTPILFEHANSMHRSALRAPDVRAMHAGVHRRPARRGGLGRPGRGRDPRPRCVRDDGRRRSPRRAGVPRTRGSRCGDPRRAPATQEARRVKTPLELALLDRNGALVMEMLAAFEAAVRPGCASATCSRSFSTR